MYEVYFMPNDQKVGIQSFLVTADKQKAEEKIQQLRTEYKKQG